MAQTIFARNMLTADGWRRDARLTIGADGHIASIEDGDAPGSVSVDVLLPAPGNVHSHAFQRAMAGLTEYRGPSGHDDFWTWRTLMYRFLEALTPEDIGAIAAQVQVEMLETGFGAIGEFHYVHHAPGGAPYANLAEIATHILEAAKETGIGYTHLPVLYMRGGMDDRALEGGQLRFGCGLEQFERLFEASRTAMKNCPADFRLGVAPHSLRAVTREGLARASKLGKGGPCHIHAAEQTGEVEAVKAALGATPVRWLLDNAEIDANWCFIHATHMTGEEIRDFAASNAVAGLCPITEGNLGDGIFEAAAFANARGRMAIGSDSNVRISLTEELRQLEYSQRLRDRRRAVLADDRSCGRFLFDHAARHGAQALGRNAGRLEPGALADLTALKSGVLSARSGDAVLDGWIFAEGDGAVSDVWAAGRHVVRGGAHVKRDLVRNRFDKTLARLENTL